jgi:hypothetical protein
MNNNLNADKKSNQKLRGEINSRDASPLIRELQLDGYDIVSFNELILNPN